MDRPDAETLHRLYVQEQKSLHEIARPYGVSAALVRKWLLRAGISTRSIAEATSLAQRGKPASDKQRAACAKNLEKARAAITPEGRKKAIGHLNTGAPWNKGKPWTAEFREKQMVIRRSPEYRRKLSEAQKGEKSVHWKGGYDQRCPRGFEWRALRQRVYERDGWTCQDCGVKCLGAKDARAKGKKQRRIQAHHVVPRRLGGTDELENLVTLCVICHIKRERKEQ